MNTQSQINQILSELPRHYGDPVTLSNYAVQLSILLYNLGDELAEAELLENQTIVGLLDVIPGEEGGKKMSVAEAEKRGVVDSANQYGKLKLNYQSLVEIIQSLKKKVDSLSQQMKSGI